MDSNKFKIESGVQLLARLIRKPEIGNFYPPLFETSPTCGENIEICCDSGSPLLIDIIAEVLVSYKINGQDTGILLFNTDGNLNFDVLVTTIRKKINTRIYQNVANINNNVMIHEILRNFHILEINDATEFFITIHKLENILMEHSNISLLIFDTLTAFYWSEQGFKITKMDLYIKNLLQIIQKVTKEYKVISMYTRPHYFNSNKDTDHIESWITETLNYRIEVTKSDKHYKVDTRTNQMQYVKHFEFADDEVKWLT